MQAINGGIMGARQSAETKRALKLIAKGMPVADAARRYGLNPSTLWKALRKIRLLQSVA